MKGEFYKMEYESWDEGTELLTLEQEGAYLRFCHQMYRRKSPVVDDKTALGRLWKCHPNKAVKLRNDLLLAGKIVETGDGHLTNTRVTQELDARETVSTQKSHIGRTGGIRSGVSRRKSLKNNDVSEATASSKTNERREEKNREEDLSVASLDDPGREASPMGSATKPSVSKNSRGTRLPSDWALTPEWRAYAEQQGFAGIEIERMADRFSNYWRAESGKKAVKLDWFATWRNWVLNDLNRRPDQRNTPGRSAQQSMPGVHWRPL